MPLYQRHEDGLRGCATARRTFTKHRRATLGAAAGFNKAAAAVTAVLLVVLLAACSSPRPLNIDSSPDTTALREAVSARSLMGHLKALQAIADANDGNRAAGTSGYEASAAYVEEQLRAAGYEPYRQTFSFWDGSEDRERETFNILADTGGRADRTIVVGAHLDSVEEGPGINDNGSGVAAVLEAAVRLAELGSVPANRVRFALWGGEEVGLRGSEHYVEELSQAEVGEHAASLNFDVVGSPNAVRFIYDGDGSEFGKAGPDGSAEIEDLFVDYFASQGLTTAPTFFDGGSDYAPFMERSIPVGGLFTGDVGTKSAEEADVYGGTAGEMYDRCYHSRCDTIENVDESVLEVMGDAVVHAVLTLAQAEAGG